MEIATLLFSGSLIGKYEAHTQGWAGTREWFCGRVALHIAANCEIVVWILSSFRPETISYVYFRTRCATLDMGTWYDQGLFRRHHCRRLLFWQFSGSVSRAEPKLS